mgnify:CR=1 FL=1
MNLNNSVCVVGGGYWGKNHIRTLHDLNMLGAIVEYDKPTLDSYSKDYSNIQLYHSVDEALKNDSLKGFTLATPASTHFEISKKILLSKRHLLVEKPIALEIQHASELNLLADKNNLTLMVGHVMLFHPAIIKIKEIIDAGKLGKLQYIYSNRLNLGKVRNNENVFWSLAPHDISIFQYLTNSFPTAIKAEGSSFLQEGIHDSTITLLKYPNGVEGHIFVSWLHPFKEHRLTIIGSEAMLTFEDSLDGKPLKFYSKKFEMSSGVPEKLDGPVEKIIYEDKMALTEELKYFCDHLDEKRPEIANGKHALEVTNILVKASNQLEGDI